MKIAVIGAGVAGLCSACHLSKSPELFQFKVLEQMSNIGGTWRYTPIDKSSSEQDMVHSSVYKNLRPNLPKEVMFIPGFPFPSHLPSFPHHSEVLKYLQDYASHYQLHQFIECGVKVEEVEPIPVDHAKETSTHFMIDSVRWKVTTRNVKTGQRHSEEYDAVLVCIGHFTVPRRPSIPGLSLFNGHVIHSHEYREPEVYTGQTVLVVGGGNSGQDISLDLSKHAKQVYLCNRGNPLASFLPSNMEELPGITAVKKDGKILFTDGRERWVDSIVLATGYKFSFPFLSEETGIRVLNDGGRVTPLYKHTFNSLHPSMAFIGINFGHNIFQHTDYQLQWLLSIWAGRQKLPSEEKMVAEGEAWFQKRLEEGLPPYLAGHFLGDCHGEMIDHMAELSGSKPQETVLKELFDETEHQQMYNLMQYKSTNYVVVDQKEWAVAT